MDFTTKFIDELIILRKEAREKKDWKLSDEIRTYLDSKLVFIFDTKFGQEIWYLNEKYFENKPDKLTYRQYVEYQIQQDSKAERVFDAWLYSTMKSSETLRT